MTITSLAAVMSNPVCRGDAVGARAEPDHDVAQRAVVDVQDPSPGDRARVDAELVAVVQVVVDHRGEHVVRGGDGVEVAGQVQVERVHRHDLAVAAAGGAALDAERRPERGLAQRQRRRPADPVQPLRQPDRGRRLALAERGRASPQSPRRTWPGPVGQDLLGDRRDLGEVAAVRLEAVLGEPGPGRDVGDRLERARRGRSPGRRGTVVVVTRGSSRRHGATPGDRPRCCLARQHRVRPRSCARLSRRAILSRRASTRYGVSPCGSHDRGGRGAAVGWPDDRRRRHRRGGRRTVRDHPRPPARVGGAAVHAGRARAADRVAGRPVRREGGRREGAGRAGRPGWHDCEVVIGGVGSPEPAAARHRRRRRGRGGRQSHGTLSLSHDAGHRVGRGPGRGREPECAGRTASAVVRAAEARCMAGCLRAC